MEKRTLGALSSGSFGALTASISVLLAVVTSGCPAPEPLPGVDAGEAADTPGPDGAAPDVSAIDALDIDTPGVDAPGADVPDTSIPEVDGGGDDRDADGVLTALDCDDDDDAVGSSSTRSCSSSCGTGIESCASGVWGACDAPTACACTTVGMMRVVPCGMCGTASQRCGSDMRWEAPSSCFSEGECFAGTVEQDTAMCGLRERLCNATCAWLPWEVRTPPGVCVPTATEMTTLGCPTGMTGTRTCTAGCTWGATAGCASSCATTPRVSVVGAASVCVPGGPFLLGCESEYSDCMPQQTVVLSEFWIGRYPITAGQYRGCVASGMCVAPSDATHGPFFAALPDRAAAGSINWDEADNFCRWDGGALPTEYQWEKAARGPAPDGRLFPWGDAPGTECDHHTGPACPYPLTAADSFLPGAVSPWGVRHIGASIEWTHSPWRAGWVWLTDLTDPAETIGSTRTARAGTWLPSGAPSITTPVGYRRALVRTYRNQTLYFRCVY